MGLDRNIVDLGCRVVANLSREIVAEESNGRLGSIRGALAVLYYGAMVGLDCGAEDETMANGAVKRWWSLWRIMWLLCSEWKWRPSGWRGWPPMQSRSQEIRRPWWSRNMDGCDRVGTDSLHDMAWAPWHEHQFGAKKGHGWPLWPWLSP